MNFRSFFLSLSIATLAISADAQSVEIEVNNSPTSLDDYFCWSPVPARIRLSDTAAGPVSVLVSASTTGTGGDLVFSPLSVPHPSIDDFVPVEELALVLPADGSWVPFNVAGVRASSEDKDVAIAARSSNGDELGDLGVMVRVRKNADSLTIGERNRFLSAVETLHGHQRPAGPRDSYEKYADAHAAAFRLGIHSGSSGLPLFLAWHRAFLLSFERELQAIDPSVALPYWRFDAASTNVFVPSFMGFVSGPSSPSGRIVQFDSQNPLFGWRMSSGGPLTRDENPTQALQDIYPRNLFDILPNIFSEAGIDEYQGAIPSNGVNAKLELRHHNYAHVANGGWLGSGSSPRDPIFFMLHANVDRAWAEWQARFDRFDSTAASSYYAQGAYPGDSDPNRLPKGSYAEDTMWPWSQDDGSSTPTDTRDDWPGSGWAMPVSTSANGSVTNPSPASMVDYLSVNGGIPSHGACYDEISFSR